MTCFSKEYWRDSRWLLQRRSFAVETVLREGVVVRREDRLRQVHADLLGVYIERGDELHVAHVVRTELHVHETRHDSRGVRVAVVGHALHE